MGAVDTLLNWAAHPLEFLFQKGLRLLTLFLLRGEHDPRYRTGMNLVTTLMFAGILAGGRPKWRRRRSIRAIGRKAPPKRGLFVMNGNQNQAYWSSPSPARTGPQISPALERVVWTLT